MEDRELESVADVPDTPDRLMSRRYSNGRCVDKMNEEHLNELGWKNFYVAENGNSGRLENYPQGISCKKEVEIGSNAIGNCHLKKLHAPHGASLFRRASIENVNESRTLQVAEKNGKCKAICSNSALQLSKARKISLFDLTEDKGQSLKTRPAITFHRAEDISTIESTKKKLSNRYNFGHSFSASASSSGATTTKDTTVSKHSECAKLPMSCGEMLDLSSGSPLNADNPGLSHLFGNQRSRSPKRLVRNGCISPHGIAPTGKQSAENSHNTEEKVGGSAVSSNITLVEGIVADEKCCVKVKGKGLLIQSSTSSGNNAGTGRVRNSSECCREQGGWKTTSRHLRNPNQFKQDGMGHPSRMNNDVGLLTDMEQQSRVVSNRRQNNEVVCILDDAALLTSEAVSSSCGRSESDVVRNAVNKRKRNQGTISRNMVESYSSVSRDSDVIFLDSSGDQSNPIPRTSEIQQLLGNQNAEVVPLSPEHRETIYLELDSVHKEGGFRARSRQLEADEKLALELQQQLYYEESALEGGEMDEYLVWNLQQEEEALQNIGPSMLHHQPMPGQSNRQSQLRYSQRPLYRRRTRSQVFVPNRMAPSRSRIVIQSPPRVSYRTRFRFPPDMDLDMHLDILEALEASEEFGDMGMADNVLNVQRDFNENDYEMLLALDENNDQHAGATANQISSLPQSKVQSTSIEEACAVCLETPTIGDTIRHLPCFHKFHKECIDPWLRRKPSCPVCKSSIT